MSRELIKVRETSEGDPKVAFVLSAGLKFLQ
jgi:hypothetical protein